VKKILPISVFLLGVFIALNVSVDASEYDTFSKRKEALKNQGSTSMLVESEELTIKDVSTYVLQQVGKLRKKSWSNTRVIGITGIFQNDNIADIYFWYGYTSQGRDKAEGTSKRIIRLNSGVWLDPIENQYIVRKK